MTAVAKPKVLVVDDDEDMRDAMAMALEQHGYEVWQASNGREALSLLERGMVDAILLDMRMPVMNGWDFAKEFHERHNQHAPIIVITAAADARRCAEEIGVDSWLAKPFELDSLIEKVGAKCARQER